MAEAERQLGARRHQLDQAPSFEHVQSSRGLTFLIVDVGLPHGRQQTRVETAADRGGHHCDAANLRGQEQAVYDYTTGIADWKAAGLAVEGSEDPGLRIADATRPDIPTATPDELLGQVHQRTLAQEWDQALVVDCDSLVAGRLRGSAWDADHHQTVDSVMEAGPTTVRPHGSLHDLLGRMDKRGTKLVVVSDPQAHLIGIVLAEDARRLVTCEPPERVWKDCEGCPGRWSTTAHTG